MCAVYPTLVYFWNDTERGASSRVPYDGFPLDTWPWFGTVLDGEELSCNMDNRLIKCDVCSKDVNVYKVARAVMGMQMVKAKAF